MSASSLGLRNIELLEGLSPEKLDALAQQCVWRNFESGKRIISRNAADRDVYLLVSGRVRITTYSEGGRQVTFRDIASGEVFGEVSAIDDKPRSADVVALETALIASISPSAFRKLLTHEPLLGERMMKRLAGMVRSLSERVIALSTLGVQNRIHAEILRLAREAGVDRNTARIDPGPKHADIASQVSTYREQVTRELSALAKAGILGKDGGALVVRDMKRLEKMVEDVRAVA
ncbi:MAG TPA: Crp/Fnr family transcriptional regulator [Burkholderiales bacterium]|nr:Crp/Fnr family transcriptional regulator [Burkholderiales bacterium]